MSDLCQILGFGNRLVNLGGEVSVCFEASVRHSRQLCDVSGTRWERMARIKVKMERLDSRSGNTTNAGRSLTA